MHPSSFRILDWYISSTASESDLGEAPSFFSKNCPDAAWLQLQDNSNWRAQVGDYTLFSDDMLLVPDGTILPPLAFARLHSEGIILYPRNTLCVVNSARAFTVYRKPW